MRSEEVAETARSLELQSPLEILSWTAAQFAPRATFATGFGPEGCVLIDLIGRHRLPIDIFTLDTGLLFPETLALWQRLEERYGLVIRRVRPRLRLDEQARLLGPELWQADPDRCCELRKVQPLRTALATFEAWISAIRRDQTPDRATAAVVEYDSRFGMVKVNPLARWTSDQVQAHLRAHDVPTNPLHASGYPSIGCMPCTSPVGPGESARAGRWRGREKTECGLHAKAEFVPLQSIHAACGRCAS